MTLANGSHIDLSVEFPPGLVAADVANALRLRCLQLEQAFDANKRAKVDAVAGPSSSKESDKAKAKAAKESEKEAAKAAKEAEKLLKTRVKAIAKSLTAACKKSDVKWQGNSKEIKVEEVITATEFASIFDGQGTLVQPTPQNKPTSTVTIRRLTGVSRERDGF